MTLSLPSGTPWKILLSSVVAIALSPSIGLAQNQSDVTGPNLSDVTGPNLSDVTGPNQSDNTGLLGESVINSFQDFFDEFGEALGIDPDASLAEQLRQAKLACSEQDTIRRFARDPGPDVAISPACAELGRLIRVAQEALDQSNQSGRQPASVERRIW
ncbi:MAG: hypothetical protein ACFB2W_05760 [Leptolyngbyaceae cyanobacterium]